MNLFLRWLCSAVLRPLRPDVLLATMIGVCLLFPAGATAQLQVTPHQNSKFWIHGNATVRDFTCVVQRIEGKAQLPRTPDSLSTTARKSETQVVVRVPVRAVDCGNDRMTRDLQEALKMEKHPKIRFELVHATMGGRTDTSAQWRRVDVLGPLTVAGTKRLTRLHAAARALNDEHFRIRGCLPIRMTYFGIDPPTKALGLIKVKNRVEVQFDLFAQRASAASDSSFNTISLTNPPPCDE